jgi:hypothetical protein
MRGMKKPKIILAVSIAIVVVVIAMMAFSAIASTDASGRYATDSERFAAGVHPTGKALVVYDPGLSGAPKDIASKIAGDLLVLGYEVEFAGISSDAAANLSGYDVIVVGGPIYGGKVSSSVQSYLKALNPPVNTTVGAFATGSIFKDMVTQPFPDSVTPKAAVLLFRGDDADLECAGFVDALLKLGV